jgi:ribonuclease BN (tRNA processing enzyme)
MKHVRIVILGSGDAFSSGGRFQSSYLFEGAENSLLLDCGATFLTSLKSRSLSASGIDMIFLSHFHGDHCAGLPFLFLHYIYIEPRTKPLRIVGPEGVEARVRQLFEAMYAEPAIEPLPYPLEFIETRPGESLRFGDFELHPFCVPHQEAPLSLGCEILNGQRKIVYSGDTGWTEDLIARTRNADLFICECNFFDSRSETHLDYLRIHENLERFGAKRLLLTHLGPEMLERRNEVHIDIAHDGMVIEL